MSRSQHGVGRRPHDEDGHETRAELEQALFAALAAGDSEGASLLRERLTEAAGRQASAGRMGRRELSEPAGSHSRRHLPEDEAL